MSSNDLLEGNVARKPEFFVDADDEEDLNDRRESPKQKHTHTKHQEIPPSPDVKALLPVPK